MLKTRVITALVLLAVLLPALFATSPWPFAGLTMLMIGAAGWEWARLNGAVGFGALAFGAAVATLCAAILLRLQLQPPPAWCWWLASAVWVLGCAYALRVGPTGWPKVSPPLRRLLGALVLLAALATGFALAGAFAICLALLTLVATFVTGLALP